MWRILLVNLFRKWMTLKLFPQSIHLRYISSNKRKLFERPIKKKSVESVRRKPKIWKINPIIWTKEKKSILTQRKIDTKGIGLIMLPPACLQYSQRGPMLQRSSISPKKPRILGNFNTNRLSAPQLISTQVNLYANKEKGLNFEKYGPWIENYYNKTVLKRIEKRKDNL